MEKFGLLIDYDWCTGCHSCEVACQMEHGLPVGQYGIVVNEVGPWEFGEGKWQFSYLPALTSQCDLCTSRVKKGKLPACVHHCQAKCIQFGKVQDFAEEMSGGSKQALLTIEEYINSIKCPSANIYKGVIPSALGHSCV